MSDLCVCFSLGATINVIPGENQWLYHNVEQEAQFRTMWIWTNDHHCQQHYNQHRHHHRGNNICHPSPPHRHPCMIIVSSFSSSSSSLYDIQLRILHLGTAPSHSLGPSAPLGLNKVCEQCTTVTSFHFIILFFYVFSFIGEKMFS